LICPVHRGHHTRERRPETAETRVVWLITQRSEVQILPPLPRPEALSRTMPPGGQNSLAVDTMPRSRTARPERHDSCLARTDTEEVTGSNPVRPTTINPRPARMWSCSTCIFTTPSLPRVPAACLIEPPNPLWAPLSPAFQLTLYELAQTIGDRPLTSCAAPARRQRRRSASEGPGGARRVTPARPPDQTGSHGQAARGQRTASFLDRHPSGKPTVCDMMAR